jgi:hypothetical protein
MLRRGPIGQTLIAPTVIQRGPTVELEEQFDAAMLEAHKRAKSEMGYNSNRFLHILQEHRGVGTAQMLLHASTVSEGYTAMWERSRLDLTVEALVLNPIYASLFTDGEREIARRRLGDYGYSVDDNPE